MIKIKDRKKFDKSCPTCILIGDGIKSEINKSSWSERDLSL